jgi:P27 family predicted phage terminase small subunit
MRQPGRKSAAQLAIVPIDPPSHQRGSDFDPPPPPNHLGKPERQIWRDVFSDFDLSTKTAVVVLAAALEAHQRARECREMIKRDGMTVKCRDGQLRPHPLLAVERDARSAFLAAIKTLGLEL